MTKIMKASEFKAKCLAVMDEVAESGQGVVVTKNGNRTAIKVAVLGNKDGPAGRGREGGIKLVKSPVRGGTSFLILGKGGDNFGCLGGPISFRDKFPESRFGLGFKLTIRTGGFQISCQLHQQALEMGFGEAGKTNKVVVGKTGVFKQEADDLLNIGDP